MTAKFCILITASKPRRRQQAVSAVQLTKSEWMGVADESLFIPRGAFTGTFPEESCLKPSQFNWHSHTVDIWPISHRLLCYLRLSSLSFVLPLRNQYDTCLNSLSVWEKAVVTHSFSLHHQLFVVFLSNEIDSSENVFSQWLSKKRKIKELARYDFVFAVAACYS